MKRISLLSLAILLALGFCIGQGKKADKTLVPNVSSTGEQAKNKPQTNIKVNKEYDDKGNIISYDSTYTWSYSSHGDNAAVSDSVLAQFKNFFNQGGAMSMDDFFGNRSSQDTVSAKASDLDDFFASHQKNSMEQMRRMFAEMDSIQNNLFRDKVQPKARLPKQAPDTLSVPEINNKQ
jgi:hypothetical protein